MRSGLEALAEVTLVTAGAEERTAEQELLVERQAVRMQLVTSHIAEQEALAQRKTDGGGGPGTRVPGGGVAGPVTSSHEMRGWLGKVAGRARQNKDLRHSRYWAVLSGGKLHLYRSWRAPPKHSIDLLLCTVKEARGHERFCFELISPSASRVLQAENAGAVQRWMAVIHNATGRLLDAQVGRAETRRESVGARARRWDTLLAVAGNEVCVDCGVEGPEWASISLGALMCLQCSGVHRALGVHVSRVRSLHLDVWDDGAAALLGAMGNARVNEIFLARCAEDAGDPAVWAGGEFISRKYAQRAFVEPAGAGPGGAAAALHAAVRDGQPQRVLLCLAQGADVNGASPPGSGEGLSPLMHAARAGDACCMELLLQRGADVEQADPMGRTALHHAALRDSGACAEALMARGASAEAVDAHGKTPLEVREAGPQGAGAHCALWMGGAWGGAR
jgi:hypothetical protein